MIYITRAICFLFLLLMIACNLVGTPPSYSDMPQTLVTPIISRTPSLSPSVTASPTSTTTITPSPTTIPSATSTPEPAGCFTPPDDYTRLEINGWILNRRTYVMLEHAYKRYGGELEITGYHITQGSYHDNGPASFGTHLGGGAVDLSVMRRDTYTVLWDEIPGLLSALREAGFAAWLREYGELWSDSPIHIHAIAIGDKELSQPAQEQLTGLFGYFRGYSGVPIPDGIPEPDRFGGPVLCQWMIDLGYADLRTPQP